MTKRQAVRRIKELLADEIRGRLAVDVPMYADDEPVIVQEIWQDTVWAIAEKISPKKDAS